MPQLFTMSNCFKSWNSLLALACAAVLLSCAHEEVEFVDLDASTKMKMVMLGDKSISVAEYPFADFSVRLIPLHAEGPARDMRVGYFIHTQNHNLWYPAISKELLKMSEGDSIVFVTERKNIKELSYLIPSHIPIADTATYELRLKLNKLMDLEGYVAEATQKIASGFIEEDNFLLDYMESMRFDESAFAWQGIYIQTREEGKGAAIKPGKNIDITYTGEFLDGKKFDLLQHQNQVLSFQYGKPDQVIKGLELALANMHVGGKAKVFIPSYLAFGEKGSSTGIVPPFTPVVFNLKVLSKAEIDELTKASQNEK